MLQILKQKDQEIGEVTEAVEKATARLSAQDEQLSSLQQENREQRSEIEALLQELDNQKNSTFNDAGLSDRIEEQDKEINHLQQLQDEAMESHRQLEYTIEQLTQ